MRSSKCLKKVPSPRIEASSTSQNGPAWPGCASNLERRVASCVSYSALSTGRSATLSHGRHSSLPSAVLRRCPVSQQVKRPVRTAVRRCVWTVSRSNESSTCTLGRCPVGCVTRMGRPGRREKEVRGRQREIPTGCAWLWAAVAAVVEGEAALLHPTPAAGRPRRVVAPLAVLVPHARRRAHPKVVCARHVRRDAVDGEALRGGRLAQLLLVEAAPRLRD
mmetsp:Transcript_11436/g.36205  ORF Transcript_11436/g.36205 Transcript_11436/m.36205 type:complete len:220 (+) Transcript_11436:571-1230(+)